MSIPSKKDVVAMWAQNQADLADKLRQAIEKALKAYRPGGVSVDVPPGLLESVLSTVVEECRNEGWSTKVSADREGNSTLHLS